MAAGPAARVQVIGGPQMRRALKHMGADLADLSAINRQVGEMVLAASHDLVPRLSGDLDASQKLSVTRTRAQIVAGSRLVPYAGPIHFGWPAHNITPQPWLYDALDKRAGEVADAYEKRVAELVTRVGREGPH